MGIVVSPVGSSGYATSPVPCAPPFVPDVARAPSPLPSKVSLATIEMSKPVACGIERRGVDHGIAARVKGDRKERGIGDGARRDVEEVAEDVVDAARVRRIPRAELLP